MKSNISKIKGFAVDSAVSENSTDAVSSRAVAKEFKKIASELGEKADVNLSNIDNDTFKSKIIESGFSSGIPIVGYSGHCTYIVDSNTNLVEQISKAISDGHKVIYIESGEYPCSESIPLELPETDFKVIGVGCVKITSLALVEPGFSADNVVREYAFENIVFSSLNYIGSTDADDNHERFSYHTPTFNNCVIRFKSSGFNQAVFLDCTIYCDENFSESADMGTLEFERCSLYEPDCLYATRMKECNVYIHESTSLYFGKLSLGYNSGDMADCKFYLYHPVCFEFNDECVDDAYFKISNCSFPYHPIAEDSECTIDTDTCFIGFGNVSTALDAILTLQESYIGGDSV